MAELSVPESLGSAYLICYSLFGLFLLHTPLKLMLNETVKLTASPMSQFTSLNRTFYFTATDSCQIDLLSPLPSPLQKFSAILLQEVYLSDYSILFGDGVGTIH